MKTRFIIEASKGARSTRFKLNCGHERSIGGHVWPSGKPVGDPADLVRFRVGYDCHEGTCGSVA